MNPQPPEDVQRSLRALQAWREGRVRNPPRDYGYGRPLHEHAGTVLDWIARQTREEQQHG